MSSYVVIFAVSVILSLLTGIIWYQKRNIVESSVIGVIWFFCSHIIACMGLFVIDWYSLFRAICLTLLLDAAVFGTVVFFRRPKPFSVKGLFRCDLSLKPMLIPLLICLLALPVTAQKHEFYGMGQDQGVYQTQAILFMHGDNARQKDFPEYHLLETEEARAEFSDAVRHRLYGYDRQSANYPDTVYDWSVSEVSGFIHGIPTHAAILALWGELFGMAHMADVETIFYLCLIFLVFCICRNLRLKKHSCAIAALCTAFAPIVIWVSKSSLTEGFLSLLPVLFLYFLTDSEHADKRWLSILPVAVFGCFHVSFYTMLPMFLMVYGGLYFFTRQRQFAVLMPLTVLLYLGSYFAMRQVQPIYTMNNYSPVFVGGVNVFNLSAVVTIVSIAAFLASVGYVWIVSRTNRNFYAMPNWNRTSSKSRWFKGFLAVLVVLPVLYILVKALLTCDTWDAVSYLSLFGFCSNAGLILLPLAIVTAPFMGRYIAHRNRRLVVFLMFFYCVLVYSAVLRFDIPHYFYYGRYLAPFLPIAAIFAAMVLDRTKKRIVIPSAALGLCCLLPYNLNLMYEHDDTRMEWEVMQDIADAAEGADCMVIDQDYLMRLWLPMTAMTEADIYPAGSDPETQLADLSLRYDDVLYLTESPVSVDYYSVRYREHTHTSEDLSEYTARILPFPLAFTQTEEDVYLYLYDKYRLDYSAAECYADFTGFSVLEQTFAWTASEKTSVSCRLYPSDYTLTVDFGNVIPLSLLEDGCMEIAVCLNDTKIGDILVTDDNNNGTAALTVPEELVTDGENLLTFESALWSAAEITEGDTRMLGFPLESVVFTPAPQT